MVEHMTRERFWALTKKERDVWERRLARQWKVRLDDTVEFWFEGRRITGVFVYRRDPASGKLVISQGGRDVVRDLLGVA